MNSGGADFKYTGNSLENYASIWDGEVNKTGKNDHRRVINALKHDSEGTNIEQYMDVDNISLEVFRWEKKLLLFIFLVWLFYYFIIKCLKKI